MVDKPESEYSSFILATKLKGFSFVKKALVGDMTLTMWLAVLPEWKLSDDLLLSSVYGGIILGVGIGLVFLGGGTTGERTCLPPLSRNI